MGQEHCMCWDSITFFVHLLLYSFILTAKLSQIMSEIRTNQVRLTEIFEDRREGAETDPSETQKLWLQFISDRFCKGDILGRALKNLDGLLQMPYGCGEQNMALLAPDIYILHYLKSTKQLTPEINEKVSQFLKSGKYL